MPEENFTLVIEDENALFYALKDISHNFKEICLKIFGMVSSKTCDIIFSTDISHPNSVKLIDRCRRGSGDRRKRGKGDKLIIKDTNTKEPKYWKYFLSNYENKRQLIKLILI